MKELTPLEKKNILHKYSCWRLIRKGGLVHWRPNFEEYSFPLKNFKYSDLLYQVLCVIDPSATFSEEKVAEAAEFCMYWKSILPNEHEEKGDIVS